MKTANNKKNTTQEIERLSNELNNYKNKYLRALADYQNLEKRISQEKEEWQKRANESLVIRLLPFLDHLEKAEIFIKDNGLKMIKDEYLKFLKEMGLREVEVFGKEFDPNIAEAIDIAKGDKDNIVIEVVRKGYELNKRVIRVAQVKISKKITC